MSIRIEDNGIIRRCDSLGRVVVPAEMRKLVGFTTETPLRMYVEGSRIVIEPYDPNPRISQSIEQLRCLVDNYGTVNRYEAMRKINELERLLKNAD